mgnify:CR=1 FL=1
MINDDSICLRCKHLEVITEDKGSDHTYVLVDCAEHLYAFPLKSGITCPYFEERRN